MQNAYTKLFSLIFITLFLGTVPLTAQTQQDLIKKAKEMGISDEIINAELKKQASKNSNNKTIGGTPSNTLEVSSNERLRMEQREQTTSLEKEVNFDLEPIASKKDSIRVFGANLFSSTNLSFAPNSNMATPKDYRLAAGDEIIIDVWGSSEANYRETISPDGTIYLKNIGLISLVGLTVEEAERRIKTQLSQIYSGLTEDPGSVEIKVSLGQIRSIKVNIVGEVSIPGTYTLSSLSTLFNALYAAQGINDIGSLREIKLYRNSKPIATFDVYDYMLNGNGQANIRLEDNDMIIVNPYQSRVKITGSVKRPGIYELAQDETVKNLLDYAGGFTGDAFTENVSVNRKSGNLSQFYTVDKNQYNTFKMHDGDSISTRQTVNKFENKITISGAVWRPGDYELTTNTNTIKKLIAAASGLKGDEFENRALITRTLPDFTTTVVPFDLKTVLSENGHDIRLMPDDSIYIASIHDLRDKYTITIDGEILKPQTIPFKDNMTVEDFILISGGLKESASEAKIIVSRISKDSKSTNFPQKLTEEFEFSIDKNLKINHQASVFKLQPYDHVIIRKSPAYTNKQIVTVQGEVLYPGDYVLTQKGEHLSDIIRRAGNLSPEAYATGASLRRKKSLDEIAKESALKQISKSSNDSLLIWVDSVYSVGIDLNAAIKNPLGISDIVLQEGDIITIPEQMNTVKMNGAVLYPTSTVFKSGEKLKNYINQAGGYATNARKRPYVVYMNGQVAATKRYFWIKRYPKIEPGCEIIVPKKDELPRQRLSIAETISLISTLASTTAVIYSITK